MSTSSSRGAPTGRSCGRWAKWGYAAYLEADGDLVAGHFHPLDLLAAPQAVLALGFGGDATRVSVQARLTGGNHVEVARIPALSSSPQTAASAGDDDLQGLYPLTGQSTVLLAPGDVDGEVDARAVATGLARRSGLAATLSAELDADATGFLLRARRTVLVKGLGSSLSGRYLVQRVRHVVSTGSHRQEVTLVRNALGLTGNEPFGPGLGLGLGGLP